MYLIDTCVVSEARRALPTADALIAATARVHNKVVVTRNVADFADSGVDVVDPWEVCR